MNINLKIWRQKDKKDKGGFKTYKLQNIDPNISFLEMLDILNNRLIKEKLEPVAFDNDCREGICCLLYTSPTQRDQRGYTKACSA